MNEQNRKRMRYSKQSIRREINKIRDKPKEMEKICQGKFANYRTSVEFHPVVVFSFKLLQSKTVTMKIMPKFNILNQDTIPDKIFGDPENWNILAHKITI